MTEGRKKFVKDLFLPNEARKLLKALNKGEAVLYAPDQDYGKNSIFVDFFKHKAYTVVFPSTLVKRTKCKVFLLTAAKTQDGYLADLIELNLKGKNMIPYNIINKEPTAELKLNQKDSDNLPPYKILDQILEMLIDENKDLQSIINKGFKKGLVVKVWKMIKNSEFKRYQSAIGPKLTKMSLVNDRRFPITNKFEI